MLLVALALALLGVAALALEPSAQVLGHVLGRDGLEDLADSGRAHVHEHVGVREALHGALDRRLDARLDVCGGRDDVVAAVRRRERALTAEVVLEHLAVGDGHDTVVVEPQPAAVGLRLDEDEVVAAVHVARVDEDAMELVQVRLGPVGLGVQVRLEVDLERELVAVVDLDVLVAVHVVLEALELEVEDGRKLLEDDALLGVLEPEALGVVPVLALERLDHDVVLERLLEVAQVFDVELDVCGRGETRGQLLTLPRCEAGETPAATTARRIREDEREK